MFQLSCCCVKPDNAADVVEVEPMQLTKTIEAAPAPVEPKAVEPAPAAVAERAPEPTPAPVVAAEPAPAPAAAAAPAPAGPSVSFEFKDASGATKTVELTEGPLGMVFKTSLPIIITGLVGGGAADKAGVQIGWQMMRANGEPVDQDYAAFMSKLVKLVEPLPKVAPAQFPANAVVVELISQDGRIWKYPFTRKPLGMSFQNRIPVTVSAVTPGSQAAELSVSIGSEFQSVGGQRVKGMDYKSIVDAIAEQTKSLPGA